jgi:hypothetical protein
MIETPIVGTFRLDGMIQGPLPGDRAVIEDMNAWLASAKAGGIHFHLSAEGAEFSIVADPLVQPVSSLAKPDLVMLMTEALTSLLSLLPITYLTGIFSTIRSEEFRPGIAIQTLFFLRSDGSVTSDQRTVNIETKEDPSRRLTALMRRVKTPALVIISLVLLLSPFFVDYRKLLTLTGGRGRSIPLVKENIIINQSALKDCIKVELAGVNPANNALVLELKRGVNWTRALSSTPQESLSNWPDYLIHLAIHQRRLRVEYYDNSGRCLGGSDITLDELHAKESAKIKLYTDPFGGLARIVIHP